MCIRRLLGHAGEPHIGDHCLYIEVQSLLNPFILTGLADVLVCVWSALALPIQLMLGKKDWVCGPHSPFFFFNQGLEDLSMIGAVNLVPIVLVF